MNGGVAAIEKKKKEKTETNENKDRNKWPLGTTKCLTC